MKLFLCSYERIIDEKNTQNLNHRELAKSLLVNQKPLIKPRKITSEDLSAIMESENEGSIFSHDYSTSEMNYSNTYNEKFEKEKENLAPRALSDIKEIFQHITLSDYLKFILCK